MSLFNFLQEDQFLKDPANLKHYAKDWTNQYTTDASLVVFPKSTEEVQKIIKEANAKNIKIVPSGGRTGLSGGAVASQQEVVLSLDKMDQIFEVSKIDSSISLQAGVITDHLQEEALKHDLFFPVEFGATGSSHIGGNVATNAGGVHVLKYGSTREWVKSLTVVTGKGEILKLNKGLIKNNTGYDFRHLFVGSEGTLGIITELEIGLQAKPLGKQVILLGVEDLNKILDCYQFAKSKLPLLAFEMFSQDCLNKVMDFHSLPQPLESTPPYYLLLELEKTSYFQEEELIQALEKFFEEAWASDGTLSDSSEQYKNLWKYRELITESISPYKPYKNDVSVKISKIPKFIKAIQETVLKEHTNLEVLIYGHIGDGNLHINTLKPKDLDYSQFLSQCESVNKILFSEIEKLGGSISAEHGVGLLKKDYLLYSRSSEEVELMKKLKAVFDPNCILNPGKIFD